MESRSGVLSYPERHGNRGTGQCLQHSPSFVRGGLHIKETTPTTLGCLRTGTGGTVQIIITGQVQAYSTDNIHRTGTGGTVQIINTGQVQAVQCR